MPNRTELVGDTASQRRPRLTAADNRPRFYPWSRAWTLESCQLYWLPVNRFPMDYLQRRWLLRFQELLSARIAEKLKLTPELFLEMKYLNGDVRKLFIQHSRRFYPLFGLGRHPKRPMPPPVDPQYIEDLQKGRIQFDPGPLQPDYTYWFLQKQTSEQLNLFFGEGGTAMLFLDPGEPPPKIKKPRLETIHDPKMREMVANTDLDGMMGQLHALQAPFLKQSKEIFAADLKEEPEYPGLLFAVPLLGVQDVFAATPDEVQQWFSLFKVYLRESPEDKGMVLATSEDIEQDLDELLKQMAEEGLKYPA